MQTFSRSHFLHFYTRIQVQIFRKTYDKPIILLNLLMKQDLSLRVHVFGTKLRLSCKVVTNFHNTYAGAGFN